MAIKKNNLKKLRYILVNLEYRNTFLGELAAEYISIILRQMGGPSCLTYVAEYTGESVAV